jgi:hypothetical protein
MQALIKVISGIMILFPCVVSAYKIDIIYKSNQSYKTIETAYKSNSHIKEINLSPRLWESADGKEKEAILLELIGPNKVVLEMENPIISGLNTKFTLNSSQLSPSDEKYVRDLYYNLKYDYFSDYAQQQAGKWRVELASLEGQKQRIDADIRAVQKQKEAYLSSTTVNVSVMVDITNNYNFDGYSGWSSSSYGSATTSVSSSSQKSTKKFDDFIRRLEHKKRDLPRLIKVSKDAIRVNLGVIEKAKADKLNHEKAQDAELNKRRISSGEAEVSIRKRLEKLQELHKSGLISNEIYEQKQREILEEQ